MSWSAGGSRTFRVHYAWVIVAITFLALFASAGVRAAPGVLIRPLEAEFGWDRASISLGVGVSILAFGLGAPLGGLLVGRFGVGRVMPAGLALIALGLGLLLLLRELWQFHLLWGVVTGLGTGAVANVLGATIAARWFRTHRGLVIGLFAAAASAGQLVFLPALMGATLAGGWRTAVGVLAVVIAVLLVPVALLIRERPGDIGLQPVGEAPGGATEQQRQDDSRSTPMREAVRSRDFWLLAGSFFVCGWTSNGLIGTHLIPHAVEHGFTEVTAAGAVALMGTMNIVGTLGSGWLTDRFDNRWLLAVYYGFRSLSIAALPWVMDVPLLYAFAFVYGLDWIATVPPTANLVARHFGRASVGTVYGWIFFAHMVGAAVAAYLGGVLRDGLGDYTLAFLSAAVLGFIAVGLALGVRREPSVAGAPARAAAGG